MRQIQVIQKESANHGRMAAPNIQEGAQVLLDAHNIQTTRLTPKKDWKRLWLF